MLRDPRIHDCGTAPETGARRFLLVMETSKPRLVDKTWRNGSGLIYRADVEISASVDSNDAEAYALAMVDGWTQVLQNVRGKLTSHEGQGWRQQSFCSPPVRGWRWQNFQRSVGILTRNVLFGEPSVRRTDGTEATEKK